MFKYRSVPIARTRSTSLGAASVLFAVILSACGQPGTSQADTPAAPPLLAGGPAQAPGSAKLPGKTRVLTSFAGGTLTHLSAEGTLTFERPMVLPVRAAGVGAEQIDDVTELNPGDILVTAPTTTAPYGFMRKVEKVEGSNGAIVVTTSPATLKDAIKGSGLPAGNYKMTKAIQTDEVIAESVVGEDGELVAQGLPAFGNEHTEAGFYSLPLPQQKLKSLGNVNVGSGKHCFTIKLTPGSDVLSKTSSARGCYEMNLAVTIDSSMGFEYNTNDDTVGPHLDRFSAKITGDISGNVDLSTGGAIKLTKVKTLLYDTIFTPVVFLIGDIPVVVIPAYTMSLSRNGTISGTMNASITTSAHGALGIEYNNDNGWKGINELTGDFSQTVTTPVKKLALKFKASFDNDIYLLFDGVAGPDFKLSTYLTFSGISNSAGPSNRFFNTGKVVGGIEGNVSISSPLFSSSPLTYEYPFFTVEKRLLSY